MTLQDRIQKDYIQALKNKDPIQKSALNYIIAQIKNKAIEIQQELQDTDVIKILKKEIKAIGESIGFLEKADKPQELEAEKQKKILLEFYLPQTKSKTETRDIINGLVQDLGITELSRQKGQIMGEIKIKYGDEIDGAVANEIINEMLK